MVKKVKSDFLFAQPSLASGAARAFDLWGRLDEYNRSNTPFEADSKAIAADWFVIGQDIYDAIEYHESECKVA
ncbi:MAG TPA: hypothetical protein VMD55_13775 [Terracidiphilus sp.]|nr:hypothetical protein [Terracidiphilus sp.]